MKYLIKQNDFIVEGVGHWTENLYSIVEFERKNDIKDLLYDFNDMNCKTDVCGHLFKTNFGSSGKISDYTDDNIQLYTGYQIHIHTLFLNERNVDDIVNFKDSEITLLRRLESMGFEVGYFNGNADIIINIYHKDDYIDKKYILK